MIAQRSLARNAVALTKDTVHRRREEGARLEERPSAGHESPRDRRPSRPAGDVMTSSSMPATSSAWQRLVGRGRQLLGLLLVLAAPMVAAQETVCARVKIEIKQELTLERQAFDAQMKINNTTDSGVLENVSIVVKVSELDGTPVIATDDPNNLNAKFFVRVSNKENILAIDGTGTVTPRTTSLINWLIIPAPGSAGSSPLGKKYQIGATLKYKFGGEESVLDVSPAVITVKPLPLLTLDYFLPKDVWADDPLTAEIEPVEPFNLGVRVKNNGYATARNLKIDSAQPKIVENNQGLLINFQLTGSSVNDLPTQNTLLLPLGDIAPAASKTGRWVMETTLAGKFTDFTAKFSHADELGGTLTSILQATNAHTLIHDVRVDLPGRDAVRDFLAQDGDVIRLYESEGLDTLVTDRSSVATLVANPAAGAASYRLSFPPTDGFVFVKLVDTFAGKNSVGRIVRSDGKVIAADNVWLSKTRNEQTKKWDYWVNFFDVNTTGIYDAEYVAPPVVARPPQVQFVADHSVTELKQVSFLVEASSPDGREVTLTAAPLPTGAKFIAQAADPLAPGVARGILDWTPAKGMAGDYVITYTANDGLFTSSRSARITVGAYVPPPGPITPSVDSPAPGAEVTSLAPVLAVQTSTSTQDSTTQLQFELYADEAATQLVASGLVNKQATAPGSTTAVPTSWTVPSDLNDNTRYWWRVRGFDGTLYSAWVGGRFFVNTANDPPDSFNLSTPAPDVETASLTPTLSWTNSTDKDGDVITYSVMVYKDADLTDRVAQATDLPGDPAGSTAWTLAVPLTNHGKYYWQVIAKDALGAETPSAARAFIVNTGNLAPTAPVLLSPPDGGQTATATTVLSIQNSQDGDNDPLTYVFELDTVNTFDSAQKASSGQIAQSAGGSTSWTVNGLVENKRYWWRVKAQDGRADSPWSQGGFLMSAVNDPPSAPTVKNPGDGAWTAVLQPTLEANLAVDPENEAVRYQFEVYRDKALATKLTDGISTSNTLLVPSPLIDKSTHWWRVRALDTQDASSAWSTPAVLYVSSGAYQDPSIAFTAPAAIIEPTTVTTPTGPQKQVTLRWDGTDPNIDATVALYYDTTPTGFAGNLILDGLRQSAGTQSGSFVWDVSQLAPGAYYVYGAIYDPKGIGRAYAPGAVVIANPVRTGSVVVTADKKLSTSESGKSATFKVKLGRAPTADVVIPVSSSSPREGSVAPASLTFTAQNWSKNQTVTVTGEDDCTPEKKATYQVVVGKAVSLDPNYVGVKGASVEVTNKDNSDTKTTTTNNKKLFICGLTVVSERKVDSKTREYRLRAELTNTGPALRGVTATLTKPPSNALTVVDSTLVFGAIGSGDTAKTTDTITLRSKNSIENSSLKAGKNYRWTVTVQP